MTQHTCAICHGSSCKKHCPYCGAYHFTVDGRAFYVNRFFVPMVRTRKQPKILQHGYLAIVNNRDASNIARRLYGHIYTSTVQA